MACPLLCPYSHFFRIVVFVSVSVLHSSLVSLEKCSKQVERFESSMPVCNYYDSHRDLKVCATKSFKFAP